MKTDPGKGKMAYELRLPLIRLLDGAGGTIREVAQIGYLELPYINDVAPGMLADMMSRVPMVSLVLGPVSGIGALLTVESHFSVMVKEKSQVFVGGPPLAAKLPLKRRRSSRNEGRNINDGNQGPHAGDDHRGSRRRGATCR